MDVSPEPAWQAPRLSLVPSLRDAERGLRPRFPWRGLNTYSPPGTAFKLINPRLPNTHTHIHHLSAIRLEEIEIAQKVRLIL